MSSLRTGLVSVSPGSSVRADDTANFAPASSEIARHLSGTNRLLYEMVTGRSADSSSEPMAPRNGQHTYGIDHSGPPFGSALWHVLAVYSPTRDTTGGSSWDRSDSGNLLSVDTPLVLDGVIDIRGHAMFEGCPYSRGYIFARMSSNTASTSMTIKARGSATGVERSTSVTQNATTTAWDFDQDGSADVHYIDLAPGRNRIRIEVSTSHASAAADVLTLVVANIAKRVHTRSAS